MRQCIYEVRYEFLWESAEPTHWESATVKVCAGLDAMEAIETAKQAALAQHRLNDNGQREHCAGFRLREVLLVAEADL
jgi:hypothetical protein